MDHLRRRGFGRKHTYIRSRHNILYSIRRAPAPHDSAADFAPLLNPRPVLILTSDDGLAPDNDRLAAGLRNLHDPHPTTLHLATDHSYSGQRIALETSVINWLNQLPKAAFAQ